VRIVELAAAMRETSGRARAAGRRVGFVPTMGALHAGHLSLVRAARAAADEVVLSIFVNPLQFGPAEDFASYPRCPAADAELAAAAGVDWLFAPAVEELYPPGAQTAVEVLELSREFEGRVRPGHFRGVATVVAKLFHVVRPHVAVFGQKDAQQAAVVRRMVRDLLLDVDVLVEPTVRDADGLACSSRNRNLSGPEREAARAIPRALRAAERALLQGERRPERIVAAAADVLSGEGRLALDYLALVDPESLEPLDRLAGPALLLVAARAGRTRLLDNALLDAGRGRQLDLGS
jgi:pantoate--beta-alanine ligase